MRAFLLIVVSAFITLGCDDEPKEILIASKPGQAIVKIDQAEVGVTPVKITIIKETTIDVVKPDYKTYTTVLSPSDDPNLIVTLENESLSQNSNHFSSPLSEDQISQFDQSYQVTQPSDTVGLSEQQFDRPVEIFVVSEPSDANIRINQVDKGTTPLILNIAKSSVIEVSKVGYRPYVNQLSFTDAPRLIVRLEKKQPATKPKRATSPSNISELKHLYQQGKINKLDYSDKLRELQYKMKSALIDLKMRYKRGGISKSDYQLRARQIKYYYKG